MVKPHTSENFLLTLCNTPKKAKNRLIRYMSSVRPWDVGKKGCKNPILATVTDGCYLIVRWVLLYISNAEY